MSEQDIPDTNIEPVQPAVPESQDLDKNRMKAIMESVLFVNESPVEIVDLVEVLGCDKQMAEEIADELSADYKSRNSGICLVRVAGGFQLCSLPDNETWLKKFYRQRNKQRLSLAAMETLAIIAYKQPITKMEIEAIRGVNVDGVVKNLIVLDLIKIEGRKEVVGRPFLLMTTRKFLEYFGLNTLKDLPKLEDFVTLAAAQGNLSDAPEEEPVQPVLDGSQVSVDGHSPIE
jgi:segregation and condensation protein B